MEGFSRAFATTRRVPSAGRSRWYARIAAALRPLAASAPAREPVLPCTHALAAAHTTTSVGGESRARRHRRRPVCGARRHATAPANSGDASGEPGGRARAAPAGRPPPWRAHLTRLARACPHAGRLRPTPRRPARRRACRHTPPSSGGAPARPARRRARSSSATPSAAAARPSRPTRCVWPVAAEVRCRWGAASSPWTSRYVCVCEPAERLRGRAPPPSPRSAGRPTACGCRRRPPENKLRLVVFDAPRFFPIVRSLRAPFRQETSRAYLPRRLLPG